VSAFALSGTAVQRTILLFAAQLLI